MVAGDTPISAKQQVRVFPKLELLPPRLDLLLGGSFQLQSSGGMRSGTKSVFESSNVTSTTVSSESGADGVVHAAALGEATVTLSEIAGSSSMQLAQAKAAVNVISLSEFRIAVQSTKLLQGNEMSVYVEVCSYISRLLTLGGSVGWFTGS